MRRVWQHLARAEARATVKWGREMPGTSISVDPLSELVGGGSAAKLLFSFRADGRATPDLADRWVVAEPVPVIPPSALEVR